MNFKFSKELIDNGSANTPSKQLRFYKIMDDKNQVIGQFFYYPKEQKINFGDREISIEVVSKFLKKTIRFLIDKKDNKQVGEYEIFGGHGVNYFWEDVPSLPTGKIKLGDQVFNFRRISTGIESSFFKQDTWGYFKFRLYTIKGNEFYEYSLKLDIPVWSKPHNTKYRPFVGTIDSNCDNVFAILAGLYLMEVEFEFEDTENSG